MAGAMDVAIGAGVESMSRVPIGSTTEPGPGEAYGPLYTERFELIHQGECAEEIARRWKITREEMDEFALRSHQRAARATDEGRFADEIVPLEARVHPDVPGAAEVSGLLSADEGVRRDTSLEKLAALKPAFSETGTVTAGTSSQISDGAAAVLIMSEERASSLGLPPRARFHTFAVAANDPQIMLTAPIPATELVLAKAKLTLDDIDLVEINEAFASVVLAWEREYRPDMDEGEPERRRHRHRPPDRVLGRPPHGHAAQRDGAHRRPLRAADDVRGRRAGERHHHRAARLMADRHGCPAVEGWFTTGDDGRGAGAARVALRRVRDVRLPGRDELLPESRLRARPPSRRWSCRGGAASGPTPTPATSRRRPTWRPIPTCRSAWPPWSWRPRSSWSWARSSPGVTVDDLTVGDEVELVVDTLYSEDGSDYLVWKWRPRRRRR